MATIRFATVRDLYAAFPDAQDDVGAEPCDEPALDFLKRLVAEEKWEAAVSYCCYLLPRREAVWWGCQSLRRIQPHRAPKDGTALDLAEAWVREPEERNRRAALDFGTEADHRAPATWMALAAGWSGGSVVPPELGVAYAPPYQTARAIRAGLMIAMSYVATEDIPRLMKPCIESGIVLAVGRPA
jgi:Family of unknown function (DUF6931)